MQTKKYQFSFEKLEAWQNARTFISSIYKITSAFPGEEKYGLADQIRRASVSVAANLAEGSARTSPKDQAHFSQLAFSSLMEVLSHLYIAYDLNYLDEEALLKYKEEISEIANKINSLRNSQLKRINN